VGVQSFDDGLLRQMERYDKYGSSAEIRDRLAQAARKIPTLNVDMIFNLPEQTLDMLDRDLRVLLDLEVDQVSFYPLMTAPTARRKMEKTLGQVDPARRYEFFQRILEVMRNEYYASSAWCFSRKGAAGQDGQPKMIDEYIIDQSHYVGVGSGAFSYVNGWMYSTTFSLNQYRQRLGQGLPAITRSKRLSARERMRYDYLVRLFGLSLSRAEMKRKFGWRFWLQLAPELLSMRLLGGTRHDRANDAIVLTDKGMYCWVLMMAEFFNAVNAFRDEMRQHIRAEIDDLGDTQVQQRGELT
jgi:coproporphyrinogen III oxidase-like Fe-S oxidoreductase